jgi:hypothetical protein
MPPASVQRKASALSVPEFVDSLWPTTTVPSVFTPLAMLK